jgi:hypothetical protein
MGVNVAVCATTGIASRLLFEGTTVHRRFGPIPKKLDQNVRVPIDAHSDRYELIRQADVVIIDECSGMNKVYFFLII